MVDPTTSRDFDSVFPASDNAPRQPGSLMDWVILCEEAYRMGRDLTPDQKVSCALSVLGLAMWRLRQGLDAGGKPGANVQLLAAAAMLELKRAVEAGS